MTGEYDLIVCGVGGIGSAALYAAANSGLRVLGIEQFGYAHDRGSSHGQTRIIRTAYFEHPNYVPLARQSWREWAAIQSQSDRQLFRKTGLIQVGPGDSNVVAGVLASAEQHCLAVEQLTGEEIERRWPVLCVPQPYVGVFEQEAGYLRVERCIAQMIALAKRQGADLICNQRVLGWEVDGAGKLRLKTEAGTYTAAQAIFAAGPWSEQLLPELGLSLQVLRKQQHWFQIDRPEVHEANGFACFLFEGPTGIFYGTPAMDSLGLKIAEHSGGESVDDPATVNRELLDDELARVSEFAKSHFRFSRMRMTHFSVCIYTKSLDEHFIVDRHPRFPQIAFVAGLSGHGFKFAPVLGRHLVGLLSGEANPQCEFLGLSRLKGRRLN